MAILIGIDEAGFGPLLGPLVVSSVGFQVPTSLLDANLWEALRLSVTDQRRRMGGKLLVTDSKKAYTRTTGITHLERTALAALRVAGHTPIQLSELAATLCPRGYQRLLRYPWYQDLAEVAIPSNDADKTIAAGAFQRDLEKQGMILTELASQCLDVAHYNRLVDAVRNKSSVLFTATCTLIQQAMEQHQAARMKIVVDRQGGRVHYRRHLQQMFPAWDLSIRHEDEAHSHYLLASTNRQIDIHFCVKADQKHLPVALASMISKYLRECLVGCINRYFIAFCHDLKPTAGYWQDGQRFIQDLAVKCPQVHVDQALLVRSR